MTALLLCLLLTALLFGVAWGLLAGGLRAGDRAGDTMLTAVEPDRDGQGIWLSVHNPGNRAALLGATIQRRSLRLRCEAGSFVSVPRRTAQEKLLAGRHTLVHAIAAGETQTLFVALSAPTRKRAELVLAVGEPDRLRVIHRAVDLPQGQRAQREAGCAIPAPSPPTTRSSVRA